MYSTETSLPSYLRSQASLYRLEQAKRKTAARRAGGEISAAEAEAARGNFTTCKRALYKRYQHAPHLEALDQALTQAARFVETGGREGWGHIIVSMPPRHGKTISVSRLFPTWFLGKHPDLRVILASYGADLARKNSRFVRNVIASPRFQAMFPDVTLADDSRAADAFDLAGHDGGLDAVGVGGGLTGKGGHIIIVDDPIKSRAEAESLTYRNKVWDWFTDDLYTRREPGAAVIVVMTRWHADDLVGRLLKNEPGKWREVRLTAIAEPGDPLGRHEGAALWPERYPLAALLDIQQTVGPYGWAGLYQQRPTLAEGGVFKRAWFTKVARAPEMQQEVRYWDLAMSAKTSADYTAGVRMGIAENGHIYITQVARGQIDWGGLVEYMAGVMLKDGMTVVQGVEQQGYMSRAVQDLNADGRLRGYAVFGYPKDKDKYTNALPFAAKCAAGLVHVVEDYWTDTFIEEICSFTGRGDETDDQVDAAAGAWEMLSSGAAGMAGVMNYADAGTIGGDY